MPAKVITDWYRLCKLIYRLTRSKFAENAKNDQQKAKKAHQRLQRLPKLLYSLTLLNFVKAPKGL
jgi:hypothetical protein